MKDFSSSERDDLVSAYLDNEATAAERAIVEASPELLERVEIMRAVAQMVAEPIMLPPHELRRDHIAAALAASATAPNVTSLATRRSWWAGNGAALASVAAVILLAVLAVPLLLLQSGGDDDSSTATAALEGDAAFESRALDDGASAAGAEEPAEESAAEEVAADAPAQVPTDDAAASDAAEAPALEAAAPTAPSADEPAAEEGEAGSDDEQAGQRALYARTAAGSAGPVDDLDQLAALVRLQLDDIANAPTAEEFGIGPVCAASLTELIGEDELVFVGDAMLAGDPVEYVVVSSALDERRLVVVDVNTCADLGTLDLAP